MPAVNSPRGRRIRSLPTEPSKPPRAAQVRPQRLAGPADVLSVSLPNAAATRALGRMLAIAAQAGDLIALEGPLGAGKTCLVTGLARGLAIQGPISSPSFALLHVHRGRLTLHHVDLYRLQDPTELYELGLWEAAESGGLLVIEWLDRFPDAVAPDRLRIRLSFPQPGAKGRLAEISAAGPRSQARLLTLSQALSG